MNEVFTNNVTKTAMDLLAMAPPPNNLEDGLYFAEYVSYKKKRAKENGNYYYEHTLKIVNDEKHEGSLFHILSSTDFRKGFTPKYNTKLYKIISCLFKKEFTFPTSIVMSDLEGKRCKVLIRDHEGFCEVVEIFREDAEVQLDQYGIHGLPE